MPSESSCLPSMGESEPVTERPPLGVVSFSASVPFVSADDTPSRSVERILTAGFCSRCRLPVMRRFDLVGVELVIHPWEHATHLNIAHPVGEIYTERYCEG